MTDFIQRYPRQVDAAFAILAFIIGANLFLFFKLAGIERSVLEGMFEQHGFHFLMPSMAGLIVGVVLTALEYQLFAKTLRLTRWKALVMRLFLTSLLIIGTTFVIHVLSYLLQGGDVKYALRHGLDFVGSRLFLSLYLYMMLLGGAINFLREVGNRFGHGIIFNYLIGRYREPIEEHRIFMFLDLNGSTAIAEKIGHVKYSRFINKCFGDLSELLLSHEGQIYQYVGDEVVISWSADGLRDPSKPIRLFQAFEAKLLSNAQEYTEKFGVVPTFKASINSGIVSVSMVGGKRKEMAYHGDVLNTAARVLEQCKQLKKSLIVTEAFQKLLEGCRHIQTVYLKELVLRGKNDKTSIYQPILITKETPV